MSRRKRRMTVSALKAWALRTTKPLLLLFLWLRGKNRRLGGYRAARSRRLNLEARKKYLGTVRSADDHTASLSVMQEAQK